MPKLDLDDVRRFARALERFATQTYGRAALAAEVLAAFEAVKYAIAVDVDQSLIDDLARLERLRRNAIVASVVEEFGEIIDAVRIGIVEGMIRPRDAVADDAGREA